MNGFCSPTGVGADCNSSNAEKSFLGTGAANTGSGRPLLPFLGESNRLIGGGGNGAEDEKLENVSLSSSGEPNASNVPLLGGDTGVLKASKALLGAANEPLLPN